MRLLVVGVTVSLFGCHDGSHGRGSEACNDWQDALCTYAADRCGAMTRQECDAQYQGVTCKSDDVASQCAEEFDSARCGYAPSTCDLNGVADPAPAANACSKLFERFCQHAVSCSIFATQEECTGSDGVQAIDCTRAVAFGLGYERCFEQIDELACSALEQNLALPPSCDDVITLRQ